MQAEADRVLAEYRQQLAEARQEAGLLREKAREEGAQIIAEMREQGEAERRRLVEAAHAQIEADRQQAINSLRNEVGTMAVELASRVVGESLENEARQRRIVERFLDDLERGERPGASMRGASRASLSEARDRLVAAVADPGTAAQLSDELFAVRRRCSTPSRALRRALTDPTRPQAGPDRAGPRPARGQGQPGHAGPARQPGRGALVRAARPGHRHRAARGTGRRGRRRARRASSTTWKTSCSGSASWSAAQPAAAVRAVQPGGPGRAQAPAAGHPAGRQGDRHHVAPDHPGRGAPART